MVYGKLIFNNIKEYTPSWIKTIPYSQTTKPLLKNNKGKGLPSLIFQEFNQKTNQ